MPGPCTRSARATLAVAAALGLVGCRGADPATVTPAPTGPSGSTVIEVTVEAPAALAPVPVTIGATAPFRDPTGLFALDVPTGWTESRQPLDPAKNPFVKVGTVFLAEGAADGLISVTQWDNGQRPNGLGVTINQVLRDVTGWMDQPGYREVNRETVMERKGEAMRIEIQYSRSTGVAMHSLALFQIDGTVFSMVNVSLEEGSWKANETAVRAILRSYQPNPGPAATAPAGAAAVQP